jgi:hypothetical protein
VERTVIVVVMRLFFQVQCDMRYALPMVVDERDVRHRDRVPQQRNHEQENGGRFAHGGNLAETR